MFDLHVFVGLDDALAIVKALIKVSSDITIAHELLIMMHKHLLLINFHESLFKSMEDVSSTSGVTEVQYAIWLIKRCLIAMTNFEAFLVPVDHL